MDGNVSNQYEVQILYEKIIPSNYENHSFQMKVDYASSIFTEYLVTWAYLRFWEWDSFGERQL